MPKYTRVTPGEFNRDLRLGNLRGSSVTCSCTTPNIFGEFLNANWCPGDCWHCYRKVMNRGNEPDIFRYITMDDLIQIAESGRRYPSNISLYGGGECFCSLGEFLEASGLNLWEYYDALAIATGSQIHISGQTEFMADYVDVCPASSRVRLYTSFLDAWYEKRYQRGILSRDGKIDCLRRYQGPVGINFIMYDAYPRQDYASVAEYYANIVREVGPRDLHVNIKVLSLQTEPAKRMAEVEGAWWSDLKLMEYTNGKYYYSTELHLRMVHQLGHLLKGAGVTSISACALPTEVINTIIDQPKVFSFISPVALALSRRTIDDAIAKEAAEEMIEVVETAETKEEDSSTIETMEVLAERPEEEGQARNEWTRPIGYRLLGSKLMYPGMVASGAVLNVLLHIESEGGVHEGGIQALCKTYSCLSKRKQAEMQLIEGNNVIRRTGTYFRPTIILAPDWRKRILAVSTSLDSGGISSGGTSYLLSIDDYARIAEGGEPPVLLPELQFVDKVLRNLIDGKQPHHSLSVVGMHPMFEVGILGLERSNSSVDPIIKAIPPHPFGKWSWEE